jgi:hypothetical protein
MDLMSVRVKLILPTYPLEYKAPSYIPVASLILKKLPRVNRLWQLTRNKESQTLSNSYEFGSQLRLISSSFLRSPPEAKEGFLQLVKGAELMLYQNILQAVRITELKEQLAVLTKRRSRKRKQIQQGGSVEYSIRAL